MLCAERWLNWSCLHVWTRNQTVPDDYLHLYKVHVASTMRILIVNMEIRLKLQCWSSIQGPLCSAFVWNHLSKIAIIRQKDLKKILKPFCFCKGALLLHCKGTFSFKEPKLLGLWEPGRGWSWGEVEFQRRMLCSPRSSWSDSGKATFLVIPVLSSLSTRFVS